VRISLVSKTPKSNLAGKPHRARPNGRAVPARNGPFAPVREKMPVRQARNRRQRGDTRCSDAPFRCRACRPLPDGAHAAPCRSRGDPKALGSRSVELFYVMNAFRLHYRVARSPSGASVPSGDRGPAGPPTGEPGAGHAGKDIVDLARRSSPGGRAFAVQATGGMTNLKEPDEAGSLCVSDTDFQGRLKR
jgi:hypothetical protein